MHGLVQNKWLLVAAASLLAFAGCGTQQQNTQYMTNNTTGAEPTTQQGTQPQMRLVSLSPSPQDWQTDTSRWSQPNVTFRQHSFAEVGGDTDPDVSADGKWLVFASTRHTRNPNLYIQAVNGQTVRQLTSDPGSEVQPSFSPDGKRIAYAADQAGNWDIWIINFDGTEPVQITRSAAHELHPSWSPDGKWLCYCRYGLQSNRWELWIVSVDNPAEKKMIGYGMFPQWCPDRTANRIVFQRARQRGSRWFSIWTIELVNGEARYPTEVVSSNRYATILPSWSPDGRYIVYCTVAPHSGNSNSGNSEQIWMVDVTGRNRRQLTQGPASNFSPTFGPDGRVYFCSNRTGSNNIWSVMPTSGQPTYAAPRTPPATVNQAASVTDSSQ